MRAVFRENTRFREFSRNREPAIFRGSSHEKTRVSRKLLRKSTSFRELNFAKNRPIFRERSREKLRLRFFAQKIRNFRENCEKTCAHFRSKFGQFWPNLDFPSVHLSRQFVATGARLFRPQTPGVPRAGFDRRRSTPNQSVARVSVTKRRKLPCGPAG